MNKQKCTKCDYEWESRIENPKACPRCKTRLDAPTTQVRLCSINDGKVFNFDRAI